MGGSGTRAITHARPRWRSYLLLARVSNLPTVWTNVLAGMVATGAVIDWRAFVLVAVAISLFYSGGMLLNDAFDTEFDRQFRPERPIPAGNVGRREVFIAGGALLAAGELLLTPWWPAPLAGLVLAMAIGAYDYSHKGSRVATYVMGLCRALVYVVAALAAAAAVPPLALGGAIALGLYVSALTKVARVAGANARWLVPLLIAGISVVDAIIVGIGSRSVVLSLTAASGFVLTLALQRYVPGD